MKLIIVVNVDWFFLSHRLPVALGALKAGYDVHILTTITRHREDLEQYGFTVHDLQLNRSSAGLLDLLRLLATFVRFFWVMRPDVVHLVTIKPVLLGGLAARFSPVGGVVYAVSGLGHVFIARGLLGKLRRGLVAVLYRFILNARNMKIIFQNPDDRIALESISSLDSSNVIMIPGSGVCLSEYDYVQPPDSEAVVLMAARLLVTKGVSEFVEAAKIIKTTRPGVRFLLVGEPDVDNPATVLDSTIKAWKKENVVELLGYRSDVAALMQKSHMVVLPSYYGEGLPKVLIEAAASGRAVVTTDMPGCRDAVENGVTGLLVPPQDARALASAMLELINNTNLCVAMGEAGRLRAEALFDVNAVVESHLEIYRTLWSDE